MKPPSVFKFKVKEPFLGNWLELELTIHTAPDNTPVPTLTAPDSPETIILTKKVQ